MSSFQRAPPTATAGSAAGRPATSFQRAAAPSSTLAPSTLPPSAGSTTATAAAPAPAKPSLPPGVRLSAHNAQALLSTGIASLDDLLGGGLPLGTLVTIDEDRGSGYAALMLGYFVSQGVQHGHHVLVASADADPAALVANAPAPVKSMASARAEAKVAKAGVARKEAGDDKMTIAWRYQNMPKVGEGARAAPPVGVQESGAVAYCGEFDITKRLAQMELADAADRLVHVVDLTRSDADAFEELYGRIIKVVEEEGFFATAPPPTTGPRPVLRIAIHAMCSPLWLSTNPYAAHAFLHKLKSLLRRSFASAMLTWSYAATPTARGPSIRALADFALGLDAFATSVTLPASLRNNPAVTGEYTGLFTIYKLARVNSLLPASAKVTSGAVAVDRSLAFQVRRKRFSVEAWSLPPELEESGGSGSGSGSGSAASGGCASGMAF